MKKEMAVIGSGITAAIVLFFATPFFPFDEIIVLVATIFYGISQLFK